jgi:hypothetical protein
MTDELLQKMTETPRSPCVLNAKKVGRHRDGAVYIGRPSKWGNPFVIGADGDRDEVIRKFEEAIRAEPKMIAEVRRELRGRDLICWCNPLPCHGDILLKIACEEI